MKTVRLVVRLSCLPLLLIAGVLYLLGAGVARYLGFRIDWGLYWLGQAWLILMQFITYALNEYFESPVELRNPNKTLLHGSSGSLNLGLLPRPVALWASAAGGLTLSMLSVLLIQKTTASVESNLVMLILLLTGLSYSIPPMRLSGSGYGELLSSFLITGLVPVFAFTLQAGSLNRLLPMVTFPLICFFLALLIVVQLPTYATDVKYEKLGLLLRLGWQRGMLLHNLLILGGSLLLGLALIWGMPMQILAPIVAVLPVGLAQIWMMNRIGQGGQPNWNLLLMVASATFGLTTYFLTYGFWTH